MGMTGDFEAAIAEGATLVRIGTAIFGSGMKAAAAHLLRPLRHLPHLLLEAGGMAVMGYFYRHNIHPYTECLRREETLKAWAGDRPARDLPAGI
jgi:hypothetical protein